MQELQDSTRRSFAVALIYGLSSILGAAMAIPAAIYLLVPGRKSSKEEWVEVAGLDRLSSTRPEEVVFRRNRKDGWKVTNEKTSAWVAKVSERQVIAYAPQCTHLGCAFHWDDGRKHFLCPCHTSTFALDGKVLEGPAPRPLDRYQVRVENGKILLGPILKSGEGG